MPDWRGGAGGALGGAASGAALGTQWGALGGPLGAGIGAGLGGLLGLFGGGGGDKEMSPELKALYQQQLERQTNMNPMYESVLRLAFSRLPGVDREGLQAPNLFTANMQTPELADGGKYAQDPMVRKALRLQQLRMTMANPIIEAIQRMAARRMPTGYQPKNLNTAPPGNPLMGASRPDDPSYDPNIG